MNRVTHFEIPTDDPQQSMQFYAETFGWSFHQFGDQPYWMINTGSDDAPGINGGLMQKKHPEQPVANSINVPDLDRCIAAIEANGGQIVVPKMAIPGVGWLAYFKDPDQNIFGVMQDDPSAR